MSETPICERCYHPKTRHVAGGCDVTFGFGEYCGCIIDSQPPAPAPNEPREGRYAYAHMCRDEVAGTRGGSDGRREVKKRKPKFRVGEVVFDKEWGRYERVDSISKTLKFGKYYVVNFARESRFRPLTRRERGGGK